MSMLLRVTRKSGLPVDIAGPVMGVAGPVVGVAEPVVGESPDCLLLSGTIVSENPDHVCWARLHGNIFRSGGYEMMVKEIFSGKHIVG